MRRLADAQALIQAPLPDAENDAGQLRHGLLFPADAFRIGP